MYRYFVSFHVMSLYQNSCENDEIERPYPIESIDDIHDIQEELRKLHQGDSTGHIVITVINYILMKQTPKG